MLKVSKRTIKCILIDLIIFVFLYAKMQRGFSVSSEAGGIWNVIQILFVLSGLIVLIFLFSKIINNNVINKWILYSFFAFPSIFLSFSLTVSSIFNSLMLFYGMATLILFYYHYASNDDESNKEIILKLIFYIICVEFIMFMLEYYNGNGIKNAISNAYYPLCLLPLIIAKTKEKFRIVPIVVVVITVLFSSKRAGLIAVVLGIIVYYLIISLNGKGIKDFLKKFVAFAFVAVLVYFLIVKLDEIFSIGIIERMKNISEDGGSGRTERWTNVINALSKSDIFSIIFGHGFGTLYEDIGDAHNDYLQVLYESGIFSLMMYICYYFALIKELLRMYRARFRYTSEFAMSIVFSIILSLFSFYVVEPTYITCGMICQGFFIAEWEKEKRGGDVL